MCCNLKNAPKQASKTAIFAHFSLIFRSKSFKKPNFSVKNALKCAKNGRRYWSGKPAIAARDRRALAQLRPGGPETPDLCGENGRFHRKMGGLGGFADANEGGEVRFWGFFGGEWVRRVKVAFFFFFFFFFFFADYCRLIFCFYYYYYYYYYYFF
jgi:hypothetical protein